MDSQDSEYLASSSTIETSLMEESQVDYMPRSVQSKATFRGSVSAVDTPNAEADRVELTVLRSQKRIVDDRVRNLTIEVSALKAHKTQSAAAKKDWAKTQKRLEEESNALVVQVASLAQDKSKLREAFEKAVDMAKDSGTELADLRKKSAKDLRELELELSEVRQRAKTRLQKVLDENTALFEQGRVQVRALEERSLQRVHEVEDELETLRACAASRVTQLELENTSLREQGSLQIHELQEQNDDLRAAIRIVEEQERRRGAGGGGSGKMGEGLKGLGYCTGGASDNIGCSTGPRSPESVQSVLSYGRDRCSSPPWLLESTDVEDYHQARAYAKDLSRDEDGLDFFSQMRASMRSVIAASGTEVDPGPFMALINQAGITKVEVSRMWNEQVDKTEAAEASVKQFQATKDRLEVELASEKSKGAELTCRVLELKAILRERNSQLAQKHVASLGQVGTPCRCGNGGGEAALDLLTPSPSTSQFQSRRYGTVVVRRALNSSPATSSPFSPTFPRK